MLIKHLANQHSTGIIFIPGFLSKTEDFADIIKNLNVPYAVYSVDLFSEVPTSEAIEYQDFLNSLNDQLLTIPSKQKILVGYSLGARLALGLYLKSPKTYSGLFLESLNPGIADSKEREERLILDRHLADQIRDSGFEEFLKSWYQNPIFALSEEMQKNIVSEKLEHDPIQIAKILEDLSPGKMPSYWEDLSKITCPVALVNGEKDSKFVGIAREVKKIIPDSKLIIASDAGHNIHHLNTDFYIKELNKFFLRCY